VQKTCDEHEESLTNIVNIRIENPITSTTLTLHPAIRF
jgi:hypothetical protein